MACCTNVNNLGLQYYCDVITFPLTAPSDGVYELIKQNREQSIATKTFAENDEIVFDNVFNEHETMTFQVLDPDGDIMEDSDGNDCFRIKITPYKTDLD